MRMALSVYPCTITAVLAVGRLEAAVLSMQFYVVGRIDKGILQCLVLFRTYLSTVLDRGKS